MKIKQILSLFIAAAAALFAIDDATAQNSADYIGGNKSATYDYTTHTGVISLESYVKGAVKVISAAQPVDVVLVLDFSGSMSDSYSDDSLTVFNGLTTSYYNSSSKNVQTQYYYGTDSYSGSGNYAPLPSKITYDGTSYSVTKVTATNPNDSGNSYKWAYITIDGKRHYLRADGIAYEAQSNSDPSSTSWPVDMNGNSIPPVVKGTQEVIWTSYGSYIQSRTISKRIHALMAAVEGFVDGIQDHAVSNDVDDRISVVSFRNPKYPNFNYSNDSDRAKYVTSGSDIYMKEYMAEKIGNTDHPTVISVNNRPAKDDLTKTAIMQTMYNTATNGLTAANYGLTLGNLCLQQHNLSTHKKIIVFFTDGVPDLTGGASASSFDTDAANEAIAVANTLKQTTGATVYSIYCGTDANTNINTYMNAVSSNYPAASSMTSLGTANTEQSYYQLATNNLIKAFKLVENQIVASASAQYGVNTVMKDYMNNSYFTLADNVTESDPWSSIQVWKKACTGAPTDSTRTFSTTDSTRMYESDGIKLTVKKASSSSEKDMVKVSGFDYSANWCGVDLNGQPHGYELIVMVPFKLAVDDDSVIPSVVNTNEENSGLYPAQVDPTTGEEILVDGEPVYSDEPELKYESPTITFCSLRIVRDSLDRGESAIYEVYSGDTFVARVSINGTDAASVSRQLYGLQSGCYTVTETDWNWAYNKEIKNDSGNFVSGNTLTKDVDDPETVVEYEFGGSHKKGTGPEDLHNHDEEYKVNLIDLSTL